MNNLVLQRYSDEFKKMSFPLEQSWRQSCLDNFLKTGLPKKTWEEYRYTPLKALDKQYQMNNSTPVNYKFTTPEEELTLECVDGNFKLEGQKELLEGLGISLLSADEALEQKRFNLQNTQDPFQNLNNALYRSGVYIRVSKQCRLSKPLCIRYFVSKPNYEIHPLILVELENGAQIKLHEILVSSSENNFFNCNIQIKLNADSSFKYFRLTNIQANSALIHSTQLSADRGSQIEHLSVNTGSELLRENMDVYINGENVDVDLKSLSLLKDKRVSDQNVQIHHQIGQSRSRQYFKSILKDEAHYIFKGKINIDSIAQGTDSDQLNKNLVLSERARVDTKPQLSVLADDVKATHGAAISQLNTDEKFYLMSRGIEPSVVNKMLCAGYATDLLSDVSNTYARKISEQFIANEILGYI